MHALEAAARPEYFCLTDMIGEEAPEAGMRRLWQRFWDWAATHPPLRCLALEVDEEYQQGLVAQRRELLALAQHRPGLRLRSTAPPPSDLSWCRSAGTAANLSLFWEKLFACSDIPS